MHKEDNGQWFENVDPTRWDGILASVDGHPLQSALWGESRSRVDGITDLRLEHRAPDGTTDALARIEVRQVPLVGKVGWLPKGQELADSLKKSLREEMKRRGFIACISDQYEIAEDPIARCPRTIWIDLTAGLDALSKNLDSQWRYGAKRALREGVILRRTEEPADIYSFFQLCNFLSERKGFSLPGSEALMQELIRSTSPAGNVGMTLYIGEVAGQIAGGALVARCGRHLHYLWGATNRDYSKYRVSEAVQWQIIQDGVALGMTRYDLEGIDPVENPGVCQFKRKMGGTEVILQGKEVMPLSWVGRVAVGVGRRLGRL